MQNMNRHHRRSIRLKGYDYSAAGLYFITICVHDRKHLFGKIENDIMVLNDYGIIACQHWEKLPERFTNIVSDIFQIMPNHIHGIIAINESAAVGAGFTPARNNTPNHDDAPARNNIPLHDDISTKNNIETDQINSIDSRAARAGASPAPTGKTVGDIVGSYKSLVAKECLEIFKQQHACELMGKLWQRNYYEHIIRNEKSYLHIAEYIETNPQNWKEDKFYNA